MTRPGSVNRPPHLKAKRRTPRKSSGQGMSLERLEERVLLALDIPEGAHPIFAPGTPQEYMAQHPDHFRENGLPGGALGFTFNDVDRWSQTATDGAGLNQGDPTTLTWGIIADGTLINTGATSNLIARMGTIYGSVAGPVNAQPWFTVFQQVFDNLQANSGIDYVYHAADDGVQMTNANRGILGVRPDIRIGGANIDGNFGTLAYAYFPNFGDIVIDTNDNFFNDTGGNSLGFRNVLAHEEGHGVGLRHSCPVDLTKLMEPTVTFAFDGPQHDDLLGINRGYGDRLEPNDNTLFATDLGVLNGTTASLSNVTIDDDSDLDLFRFSATGPTTTTVTVNPFGFTYPSGPEIATSTCGANNPNFDSLNQSDLSLEILDSTGAIIANANANGLGVGENLANVTLPAAGDYFVRLRGAQNAAQFYTLSVNVAQSATGGGKSGSTVQLTSVTADDVLNTPRDTFGFVLRRSEIDALGGQPALDIRDPVLLPDPVNDIKAFTVFFDGALDPISAEDEANYDLRSTGNPVTASDDGLFDTTDDFQYHVTPRYITTLDNPEDLDTNPDPAVVLEVQLPAGLTEFPSGRFRLTVRGGDPVLGANNLPINSQDAGPDEVLYFKTVHRPTAQPPDGVTANVYVDVTNTTAPFLGTSADPFNDIQTGLNAAAPGQTVLVRSNLARVPYVQDDLANDGVQDFDRNITVPANVRLVFQQGAIVKLRDAIIDVSGANAQLDAIGTFDNPVVFTSFADTLPDTGAQTGAPKAEDWGGIVFRAGSDSAGSRIEFAEIRYTGGEVGSVRYGAVHGLTSQPTVTNTIITSAGQAAFSFDLLSFTGTGPSLAGNFLERNTINGVLVVIPQGTTVSNVPGQAVMFDDPIDHVFTQSLTIPGGASVTTSNTNLKLSKAVIDLRGAAAAGTPSSLTAINTHFTSIQDDTTGRTADEVGNLQTDATGNGSVLAPQPGDWGGIDATTDDPTLPLGPSLTILSDVDNAGALAGQIQPDPALSRVAFGAGTFLRGGFPQIIRGNIDYGETFANDGNLADSHGNTINIQGTTIASSLSAGLFLTNAGGVFQDNDFLSNSDAAISIDTTSFHILRDPVFRRNITQGNQLNALAIRSGTFGGGADRLYEFNDPDIVHVGRGNLAISDGSGLAVLTLHPGVAFKAQSGAGLTVTGADYRTAFNNVGNGALVLDGDPDGAPFPGKLVGRFTTSFAGLNNDLSFTAREPLPRGNFTIRFVATGALSASVVPGAGIGGADRIDITIAAGTTTAKHVRDVVLRTPRVAAVLDVALAADSDGTGLVAALAETALPLTPDESPRPIQLTTIADDSIGPSVFRFGQDGRPGRAGVDDDGDGLTDEGDELGTAASDDEAVPQTDAQGNGSSTPTAADFWTGLNYSYFSNDLVPERDINGNGALDPWEDLNSNGVFDQLEETLDWRTNNTAGLDIGEDHDQDGVLERIVGNVANFIEVRFATNGILHEGPRHSATLADSHDGELGATGVNESIATATPLGNIGGRDGNDQVPSFRTPNRALRATGNIASGADVDFWSFTANPGSTITIDIDHTTTRWAGDNHLDPIVSLFYVKRDDPGAGKLILWAVANNNDSAVDTVLDPLEQDDTDPALININVPGIAAVDDTYYAAVTAFNNLPDFLFALPLSGPDMQLANYACTARPDGGFDVVVLDFDAIRSDDTFDENNAVATNCPGLTGPNTGGGDNVGQYSLLIRETQRDIVYPSGSFEVTNSQFRNITGDAVRIATPADPTMRDRIAPAVHTGGNTALPTNGTGPTLLATGARIENNEFANIGDDGVELIGDPGAGRSIRHDWVLNNTFFNTGTGLDLRSRLGATVLNNIFADVTGTAIASDGTSAVGLGAGTDSLVVSNNLYHSNGANGLLGTVFFPNLQSPASDPLFFDPTGLFPDLRITDNSAAVDSSLSDLEDRLGNVRLWMGVDPSSPVPVGGLRPESLLVPERVGRDTALDRNQIERIDLPELSNPNLGLGEDPFFDIGANEATDFLPPQVIRLGLAPQSDTGEINEVEPLRTRQSRPTFRGLVVDFTETVGRPELDEVAGLQVDIDVDGDGYDDGAATTSLFFDPETGFPVFYNVRNNGLVVVREVSLLPTGAEFRRVGVFEVQSTLDIVDSADLTIRARVLDKAGRSSADRPLRIAVDTVRPGVQTVTSSLSSSDLVMEFDEQVLLAGNNLQENLQLEVTTGAAVTAAPDLANAALVGNSGGAAGDLFGTQHTVNDFVIAPLPVAGSDGAAFFRGPFNNTTGADRPVITVNETSGANLDLAPGRLFEFPGPNNDLLITGRGALPDDTVVSVEFRHVALPNQPLGVSVVRTQASLPTALAGVDNDIVFTAHPTNFPGSAGNALRIEYRVAGLNTPLTVAVSGAAITVNVATNATGQPTSTAAQVRDAVNASGAASTRVSAALASGNSGTGVVAALPTTSLSGGRDAIGVTLDTDGAGAVDSTTSGPNAATTVRDAINAAAGTLVTASLTPTDTGAANTGAGAVAAHAAAPMNTGEFTISLWTFIRDHGAGPGVSNVDFLSPTRRPLATKRDATTGQGWSLVLENIPTDSPEQFLVFEVYDAAGARTHRIQSTSAVPSNQWAHVALSYNPVTAEWRFHLLQSASTVMDPDGDGAGNDRLHFVAAQPGAIGNSVSIDYTLGAAEQVFVTGSAVTVQLVAGTTTANRVLQMVAADPNASQLFVGRLAPGSNGTAAISRAVATRSLTGGQGPAVVTSGETRAEVTIGAAASAVRFQAVQAGAGGNAIRVQYTAGGTAQVSVAGSDVTVQVTGTTTAAQVVQLINAHTQASQLLLARLPDGSIGGGLVGAVGFTSLTGGVFPLSAATTGDLLIGAEAVPAASATFDGFIDEVQIWNRDVSLDEISQLPSAELPRAIAVRNVTGSNQDLPIVAVSLTTVAGRTQVTATVDGDPTTAGVQVLPRGNVYELEVFAQPTLTDVAGNRINGRVIAFGVGEDVFDLNTSQFNAPPEFPLDPNGRNDAPTTNVFTDLGTTAHRAVVLDFSQSDLTVTPVSAAPALPADEDWFRVDVLAAGEFTAGLTARDPNNDGVLNADEGIVVEVFRAADTTTPVAAATPSQVATATRTSAVSVSARELLFLRVRTDDGDDFNRYELELIVNDLFDAAAGFTLPPATGPLPIDLAGRNDDAQAIMAATLITASLAPGNSGAGFVAPLDFPLAGGVDTPATQATLTTSVAGNDNDLVFTAVPVGAAGNGIRVRYVNAGVNQPLGVTIDVANRIITVNLATNGAGTVTTTANDILQLLQVRATDLGGVADRSLSDFVGGSDLTIAVDPVSGAPDVDFYRMTSTAVGTLSLFMNVRDPNGDGQLDDGLASGRDERIDLAIVSPADPLGAALATATQSVLSPFLFEIVNQSVSTVGQEFWVRVRGTSAESANAYDLRMVNDDRFELAASVAPVGDGILPDDPDGRNDVVAAATDLGTVFTFAEDDLTITLGDGVVRDTDFFLYTAPDDLVFNVFADVADINRNGALDAAETLGLEVLDPTGTTVLATGSVFGTFPGSVIVDSGFVQLASGQSVLIRVFGSAGVANSYDLRALADDRFDHPFRSGTVAKPGGVDPAGRNDSSDDASGAGADDVRRTDLGTVVHLTENFLRVSDEDSHNFLFTAPTPAAGLDGQTLTIDDGLNPPTIFEFDNNGSTALGQVGVNFAALTTADELAAAIRSVINGIGAALNATASGSGSQVAVSSAIRVVSGAFPIAAAHDGDWFRVTAAVSGALGIHVDLIDADRNNQIDAVEILGLELYELDPMTNRAGDRLAVGVLDVVSRQVRIDGYPAMDGESFLVRVREGVNLPVAAVSGGATVTCNLQPLGPPAPAPVGQPNDDLSSGPFNLGFTFEFFGNNFTQFFVNNNGNITFTAPLFSFTATGFPNPFGIAMVAPFWADVDTRGAGSGLTRLQQGTNPSTGRPFIQVDWPDVGYFSSNVDKLNDFSLYIEDDPLGDLICFDYRDMEWTTGDVSGGTNGFGGTGAAIGFDAGDGVNFISLGRPNDATGVAAFANRTEVFVLGPGGVPGAPPSPPPPGTVNASNDGGNDQVSPAAAINPLDTRDVASVVQSVDNNTGASVVDVLASNDGGLTFTRTRFTSTFDALGSGRRSSPDAVFDANGNLYVAYAFDNGTTRRVVVTRSTDQGLTFSAPALLTPLGAGAVPETVSVATGRDVVNPNQQNVFVAWSEVGGGTGLGQRIAVAGAAASTPGGTINPFSFTVTKDASSNAATGQQPRTPDIGVDRAGRVFATWTDYGSSPNPIRLARDDNFFGTGLAGFGSASVVTTNHVGFRRSVPAQPQRGVSASPSIAIDRSDAADPDFGRNSGRIYVAYTETGLDGVGDLDTFLRFSDDAGASWSRPQRINSQNRASQFNPAITVDSTTGHVFAVWQDTRRDVANTLAEPFIAQSIDGGLNFQLDVALATAPSSQAGNAEPIEDFGDRMGIAAASHVVFAAWADNTAQATDLETLTNRLVQVGGRNFYNLTVDNSDRRELQTVDREFDATLNSGNLFASTDGVAGIGVAGPLATLDEFTGAGTVQTEIDTLPAFVQRVAGAIGDIDFSPTGELVGGTAFVSSAQPGETLVFVDPDTGLVYNQATITGVGLPQSFSVTALEFQPGSGTLFVALDFDPGTKGSPSQLGTINVAGCGVGTCTVNLLGQTNVGEIGGLAFNPVSGELYGVTSTSVGGGDFVVLSTTTGAAISTVPSGRRDYTGLEFSLDGLALYGVLGPDETIGAPGDLVSIDPFTGQAGTIGATSLIDPRTAGPLPNAISGISFRPRRNERPQAGTGGGRLAQVTEADMTLLEGEEDWYRIQMPVAGGLTVRLDLPDSVPTDRNSDGRDNDGDTLVDEGDEFVFGFLDAQEQLGLELYDSTGAVLLATGVVDDLAAVDGSGFGVFIDHQSVTPVAGAVDPFLLVRVFGAAGSFNEYDLVVRNNDRFDQALVPSALFGSDAAGQLVTVNGSTGLTTAVGPLAPVPTDIEFHPRDVLFGESRAAAGSFNNLLRVDPATGTTTVVCAAAPCDNTVFAITALEFDATVGSPTYQQLFAATINNDSAIRTSTLISINPNTGQVTNIGDTSTGEITGLTFAPDPQDPTQQVLYGVTNVSGTGSSLVQFDLTTGRATTIGPTGFVDLVGLDFDPTFGSGGTMFAVTGDREATANRRSLVRIDTATGVATRIATGGALGRLLTGLTVRPQRFGNDAIALATDLGFVSTRSELDLSLPPGEEDWYTFVTATPGRMEVRIDLPDSNGDGALTDPAERLVLELYDSDGTTLLRTGVYDTTLDDDGNGVAGRAHLRAMIAGTDNDLRFTAAAAGATGNLVSVELRDPGAASQTLSVTTVGNAIVVRLATNATSAITSTAQDVIDAIRASAAASALVSVAGDNTPPGDFTAGGGLMAPMAATNLIAGDLDDGFSAFIDDRSFRANRRLFLRVLSAGTAPNLGLNTYDLSVNIQPDIVPPRITSFTPPAGVNEAIGPVNQLVFDVSKDLDAANVADLSNYTLVSSGNPTSPLPIGSPTVAAASPATLTTNLAGNHNDLVFDARIAGTDGNAISVAYVFGSNLSVSVAGSAITVNVVPSTRASEVRQALLNNVAASGLVQVTFAPGNDGSGFVSALAATNLAGGMGARVTIPISPPLVDEVYTFTIDATTPSPFFTDNIGNRLDGEFGGVLPSGDGAEGGNFVYTFKQDTTSATIDDFDLDASSDDNPATPHDAAFADDNRTADSTPTFTVTATDLLPGFIPGVRADIDVDGNGFNDGSCLFAGAATATTTSCVVTSTTTIPDVVGRVVAVRLTDTSGNTSTANVTVDVDAQPIDTAMSTFGLSAASDDAPAGSVAGDSKTNDSTPSFEGSIRDTAPFGAVANAASLVVLLDADGDGQFNDGQGTTNADGSYTVTSTTTLADGSYTARLQVVDKAGNTLATDQTLSTTFTVGTTGPRVIGLTPFPGTITAPTEIVVTFDADDVNPTTLIAVNFVLTGVNSGDISGQMTIDAANLAGDTFTIPLTGIIASDLYTFTIEGDTSVADEAGNRINGEFSGAFPSGNGTAGGDFVAQFTVDSIPPEITAFILADVSDIQTQPGNNGANIDDDRTDDATPVFSGTVTDPFPGSLTLNTIRIDIDVDGDGLFNDGSGFADAAGNFAVTATTAIAPDTDSRQVRARATDSGGLGNASSVVSTTIQVDTQFPDSTFELRRDDGAALPTNRTSDTTPSFGGVFSDPSPFNTAADLAGVTVELDIDGNGFNDGSDQTDSTGAWQVETTAALAVGVHPDVRVRFSDKAGHEVIKTLAGGIEIETTAPRVTSITPLGLRSQAPTTIVVGFDESMLNVTSGALFAHSVRNPANVDLRRSGGDGVFGNGGDVVISLTNFAYSETGGFRLTITLPLGLPDDQYRFTVDATSSFRDQALNQLDGEFVDRNFTGTQDTADLPSGDGVAGGDFVMFYAVDTQSPSATLALNLPIDVTGPDCPVFIAAYSGSVGDTGVLCDRQTNLDRPFLSGRVDDSFPGVDGNLPVELDVDADGFDDGTTTTRPDGTFLIQPSGVLAEGTLPVSVRVTDLAGNVAIFSTTVIVDLMSPPAATQPDLVDTSDTGLFNTDNNTSDNTPTFRGSAEAGSTVALFAGPTRIGSAQADSTGAWVVTTDPLTDGLHAITAQATDAAGNVGPASPALPVTIDTVAPASPSVPDLCSGITALCTQVSDTGPFNGDNITNDNTPQFVGSRGAAGSTIALTVGGQAVASATPNNTGAWVATITQPLADGVFDFQATATDLAGNVSQPSGNLTVTIDTAIRNPSTPDLADASDTGSSNADNITADNTPELSGTADAGVTVSILSGVVELASGVANNAGTWSITLPFRSDGAYSFTARARDTAGNTSGVSQAINVTIDTGIAAPRISGVSKDNGVSATDGLTNDPTLIFSGTAEIDSRVTLTLVGGAAIGTADPTDSQGNWFFDHSGTPLAAGTHRFTATTTDVAGNTSTESVVFSVIIDLTAPPTPPTAVLADDTGVRGDNRTNRSTPALRGSTGEAGALVEVLDAFTRVVGTATAGGDGTYAVQVSNALADGPHNLRIRSTDPAGNANESAVFTITVDTTPLRVLTFTPAPGALAVAPTQIVATLNGDDINATALGDPAFGGSLQNPANYSLVRSAGDGVFGDGDDVTIDISNSRFEFIPATKQLVITLQSAPGVPLVLGNDTYRFTINGVGSLQDIAGNAIDGDNNAAPGGNFVSTFGVNVPTPRVIDIQMAGTKKVVREVRIFFDRSLDPATAQRLDFFDLRDAGKDGRFDDPFVAPGRASDDRIVQLSLPVYTEDTKTVLLNAVRGFIRNRFLRLVVKDDVRDLAGGRLDGNGNGVADNDGTGDTDHHTAFILRGNSASFRDNNGDKVTMGIRKVGFFDVVQNADHSGRSIRLDGVRPDPNLTQVFGSVAGGDGRVHFDALTGSAGIDILRLPRCTTPTSTGCFDIGTVSAQVADAALGSGETAASLLADAILHATPKLRRRR